MGPRLPSPCDISESAIRRENCMVSVEAKPPCVKHVRYGLRSTISKKNAETPVSVPYAAPRPLAAWSPPKSEIFILFDIFFTVSTYQNRVGCRRNNKKQRLGSTGLRAASIKSFCTASTCLSCEVSKNVRKLRKLRKSYFLKLEKLDFRKSKEKI